ncbi:D-aspartate oxidase-like isoform X2 [Lineus longissimus]
MAANPKICIVGAGAIGLSTGVRIQEIIPRAQVTIIADKFSPDCVSNVAAGYLRMPEFEGHPDSEAKRKWSEMTWEHIQSYYTTPEGKNFGMELITGFRLNEKMPENQTEYHAFREMTAKEKLLFPTYDKGFVQTTFLLEGGKYLPWLTKKFASHGGKLQVITNKLKSLQDIKGDYDVIVNCSGGGAKELVNDDTVTPIRGQIELVKAPWLKHFIFDTMNNIYMFPCQDHIVVGGTYQIWPEVTTPNPRKIDRDKILSRAARVFPAIKDAEVVGEKVGFRPHRPSVRLESDVLHKGSKQIPVIHNYGHGAYGIILHWGCAVDAAKLVADSLGLPFTAKL